MERYLECRYWPSVVGPSMRPVPPRRVGSGISHLTMSDFEEKWKPIPNFEGRYEVSNKGRVRSAERCVFVNTGFYVKEAQILTQQDLRGYRTVMLEKNGRRNRHFVHHLVLKAFFGFPPGPIGNGSDEYEVNHKDGITKNNFITNLEWCTSAENMAHANRAGLLDSRKKLTAGDVREARRRKHDDEATYSELADDYEVALKTIYDAVRGVNWSHITKPPPVSRQTGYHATDD